MKKLTALLAILGLIGLQVAFAQTRSIKGTVTSKEDGMGLPGVNVSVKGTSIGTATDGNGNFTLSVAQNAQTLVISSIGYQSVEMPVQDVVNVVLEPETKKIDEVIVVAYGTAKKSSFTGSVGSVSEKQLTKIQSSDATKALEGAIAGVTISQASGQPGQSTTIRIRGIGSINASSSPLIIVDGAPYEGSINSINTGDISTMNVLKDAASASLYGARGANGVIVITTKRGKEGETSVNFDAKAGYNFRGVAEYDIMTSPADYYEKFGEALYNQQRAAIADGGLGLNDADARLYAANNVYNTLGYNVYDVANDAIISPVNGKINPNAKVKYKDADWNNWENELYTPRLRNEYNLSISKGNEKSKLYFSAGYLNDAGYNKNSYFTRYSTRLSYDAELFSWLNFGTSAQLARTESNWTSSGSSYTNAFQWTRSIAPIYPIYKHDINGNIMLDPNGKKLYDYGEAQLGVNGGRAYGAMTNPVATQNEDKNNYLDYYANSNSFLKVTLPFDVTFTTNATVFGNFMYNDDFTTPLGGSGKTYNGIGNKSKDEIISYNLNQILNWNKKINDFNVGAMLGHEIFIRNFSSLYGSKQNFLDPKNTEFSNAAQITALDSYTTEYKIEGYFGQITTDYKNRYFLSGSVRRDASSVFHPDNRWGTFWSVGASWRVNEEEFMKQFSFIDNLKLKASYGSQGNDYLYLANSTRRSYTPFHNLYVITSDGTNFGISPRYMGNKEVTWEKNLNFNAGLEFSILNGVLSGEVEYFKRTTNDLLFNLPVSPSTGFTSQPYNIGNMDNTGFELTLSSNIIRMDKIRWNVGFNITHFKNEITSLPEQFREKGITNGNQKIIEGGSIYDFYMVKWAGVDQTNGQPLYWTKNATTGVFEKSTTYNAADRQKIGSAIPDSQGGFSSTLEAYNFDLSLSFAYQIGGLINDSEYSALMHSGTAGNNWHKDIQNSWTPTNTNTDIPSVQYNRQDQGTDRFVTDASFLSFRNVTLGYTLPKNVVNKIKVKNLRVYFVVDNVALWSKRQGLDPRQTISGVTGGSTYSPIRTCSVGLVVNL